MIIPDVNMLLFGHFEDDERYSAARPWWDDLLDGSEAIGLPWAVVMGFIRISTNPAIRSTAKSTAEAMEIVNEWLHHAHVEVVEPGPDHMETLERILVSIGRGGNIVSDAHIAAMAIENDAVVHSHDDDFGHVPGLRWQNPLASDG